ncbi:zonadhesin-like [Leptopilina boulardi]|uniref:zonadhesin-like n=1 Tax=Leptopilina boulardi TaxID=63433 RepID=UPI0021F565E5|nr:zonadhesin-like [Leptopilina boulardi]
MSPIFTLSLLLAIAAVHSIPCGPNAIYNKCGSACRKTCLSINDNRKCLFDKMCHPGCECIEGYVRDLESKRCVLPHQCPRTVPQQLFNQFQCGLNKIFTQCGSSSACRKTCLNINDNRPCPSVMSCRPTCECIKGYIMDLESNRCILPQQCPRRIMPVYRI